MTLKVDEIQNTSGGAVTLTNQEAVKHYVNYDAADSTVDSSLNQSSITDVSTGEFESNFSSNFSSATDKVHVTAALNSTNGGQDRDRNAARAGIVCSIGMLTSDTYADPLSSSYVQFATAYGSNGSGDGNVTDYSASYVASLGALA